MVEQWTFNPLAVGSSPTCPIKIERETMLCSRCGGITKMNCPARPHVSCLPFPKDTRICLRIN